MAPFLNEIVFFEFSLSFLYEILDKTHFDPVHNSLKYFPVQFLANLIPEIFHDCARFELHLKRSDLISKIYTLNFTIFQLFTNFNEIEFCITTPERMSVRGRKHGPEPKINQNSIIVSRFSHPNRKHLVQYFEIKMMLKIKVF